MLFLSELLFWRVIDHKTICLRILSQQFAGFTHFPFFKTNPTLQTQASSQLSKSTGGQIGGVLMFKQVKRQSTGGAQYDRTAETPSAIHPA